MKNISGPRIKQARRLAESPISQKSLSAKLAVLGVDLSQKQISRIESQDRVVCDWELKAIAEALAVTLSWLMDETPL
jgi:ribosome-binding protein aMBF1 (putative translation factor)